MKKVEIYTDGACSGNPGPGGYGVLLRYNGREKEISAGYKKTTNNRMELLAIIIGLEALKESCEVNIYSDSKYIIDALTKGWLTRWKANRWKRNKTDAVKNIDLWKLLLPQLDKHNIKFHWVKGHAGHLENERCDTLAVQASNSRNLKDDI